MGFPISTISSVAKILAQSFKLYFRNGNTLIFITLISSLIYAALSLSAHLSATEPSTAAFPAVYDAQNPKAVADSSLSHGFKIYVDSFKDGRIWSLTIASSFAYLLIAEATILVSAAKLFGKSELRITGLVSLARTRWKRPLFALFLKKLSGQAVSLIFLLAAYTLSLITEYIVSGSIFTTLLLVAVLTLITTALPLILVFYIPILCDLGLVVSVLEENSGFAAFEKVSKLLKGSKLKVNLLSGLTVSITVAAQYIIYATATNSGNIVVLTLNAMIHSFEQVIWLVCLTVFYCESRKIHGDDQDVDQKLSYALKYSELPHSK